MTDWTSPDVDSIHTDVCIVGAGPAGITTALELSRQGVRSVLLESGAAERDPEADALSRGENVGESYFPLDECRVRALGGTSRHWHENGWFRARPFDEIDFVERPGIPHSGWPLTRSDLDRHYATATALCGVGPNDYELDGHPAGADGALGTDPAVVRSVLFRMTRRDWGAYRNRIATDPNITQLLSTTLVRIELDGDGRTVVGVEVVRGDGTRLRVVPQRLVLATGGIENARLLLANNDRHPAGIGNAHDVLGRYFHEHLSNRSGWIVFNDPSRIDQYETYLTVPGEDPMKATGAKLSLSEEVVAQREILNATFFLERRTASRAATALTSLSTLRRALTWRPMPPNLRAHAREAARGVGDIARAGVEQVQERTGHEPPADVLQMRSMAEQVPNPRSRVTLADSVDRHGIPKARLEWRLTELDHHSLRVTYQVIDAELRRAGIGHIESGYGDEPVPSQVWGNWHHMGATRMHDDPRRGVVDRDCRVHGIDNLFVAGSSVFPTGGYANPTLTIVALAARLAGHLASTEQIHLDRAAPPVTDEDVDTRPEIRTGS